MCCIKRLNHFLFWGWVVLFMAMGFTPLLVEIIKSILEAV